MKLLFFLTTILLVTVNGYVDEWNLVHFEEDDVEIYNCLNTTTSLWNKLRNYMDIARWKDYFLDELSTEFHSITLHIDEVNITMDEIVDDLVRMRALHYNHSGIVRAALVKALLGCTENETHVTLDVFLNQSNYHELPYYYLENPNITELLNLVLVDVINLIQETMRLSSMCTFARYALGVLEVALRRYNSYSLSTTLRSMWDFRAENFFDFTNELPYMTHSYSVSHSRAYTRDDPSLFSTRSFSDYSFRNVYLSREDIFTLLRLHPQDREIDNLDLFYSLPNRRSMTEADMYYEVQENLFFRVTFLYLELVERGFVNLDDDDRDRSLRNMDIPDDLLQMLYNDTHYAPYLEMRRSAELDFAEVHRSPATARYVNSLRQHNHILEPDVIMLFYHRLQSLMATTGIAINSTTPISASSTLKSEDYSKDRETAQIQPGKAKNQETDNDMNSEDYYSIPSCSKNFQNSQQPEKMMDRYHGYIVSTINSEQSENKNIFSKLLQDALSNTLESVMHIQKGLTCF